MPPSPFFMTTKKIFGKRKGLIKQKGFCLVATVWTDHFSLSNFVSVFSVFFCFASFVAELPFKWRRRLGRLDTIIWWRERKSSGEKRRYFTELLTFTSIYLLLLAFLSTFFVPTILNSSSSSSYNSTFTCKLRLAKHKFFNFNFAKMLRKLPFSFERGREEKREKLIRHFCF